MLRGWVFLAFGACITDHLPSLYHYTVSSFEVQMKIVSSHTIVALYSFLMSDPKLKNER